jgi:ketosteroid isomerase-like protein
MRNVLTAIGVVLAFWLAVPAQSKDEADVTSIIKANAVAFATNDLPTMERIWANSEDVVIFEGGRANYGWTDYRDNHLAPEMKEIQNAKFEFTDIKAKVSKDLAFATMKYYIAGDVEGKHFESRGVGTAVLEKIGGKWKLVHFHTSSPRKS